MELNFFVRNFTNIFLLALDFSMINFPLFGVRPILFFVHCALEEGNRCFQWPQNKICDFGHIFCHDVFPRWSSVWEAPAATQLYDFLSPPTYSNCLYLKLNTYTMCIAQAHLNTVWHFLNVKWVKTLIAMSQGLLTHLTMVCCLNGQWG